MKKLKASTRGLIISLVLMILLSFFNWGVVSTWGDVQIDRVNFVATDGLMYSALVYIPSNAKENTPAPGVILFHGANGNARNHEAHCLEFARRGVVSMSVDWNGAGDSESYSGERNDTPPEYWDRYRSMCEYFMGYMTNLPFVDQTKVCTLGHSMGCTPAYAMAVKYNCFAAFPLSGLGNVLSLEKGPYDGNLFVSFGSVDVDSNEGGLERIGRIADANGIKNPELDKLYGSIEQGNTKYFTCIDGQIHEGVFVNRNTIEKILWYMQTIMEVPNPIAEDNQIWMYKDFIGLFGMIAFVAFLVFLALFIIDQVPAFTEIKQPLPRNIGLRGTGLAISIIAAVAFPLLCMYTGTFGLATALGRNNVSLFSMGVSNKAFSLMVGMAVFGFVMFFVFLKKDAKGASLYDLGLSREGSKKFDGKLILKSFVLAVFVVFIGWTYLRIQQDILGTDFYCQFFGFKPLSIKKFTHYIPYIIVYIFCFILSALSINVERRLPSTGNETKDTVIAMLFNSVVAIFAVTFIVILQNQIQLSSGGTFQGQAMSKWAIDITRLWGMPVGMFLATSGNTYLYRKTGSIWLGAFLMGIVACLGCVLYGTYYIK